MQIVAKNNRVLTELPSLNVLAELQKQSSHAEFYQQIASGLIKGLYTKQVFTDLGNRLIVTAEHAYRFRRMATVEQASQILRNLPLPNEYRSVGHYYEAACLHRKGQYDEERAKLQCLIEEPPQHFRSKALTALSASYIMTGDFQSSLSLGIEAGRAASSHDLYDPQSFVISKRHIAVIKSISGDHRGAAKDLEGMLSLVRAVGRSQPYLFYEHLNSLAVELAEVGRLEEAQNICRIVLASPYAFAYPEWRETSDDIALKVYKSRSVKSNPCRTLNKNNVSRMPAPDPARGSTSTSSTPSPPAGPARVFSMQKWKEMMGKEPNGDHQDSKSDKDMNQDEMLYEIMNIFTEKDMDREIRLEMLESIRKLAAKKRANKQEKELGKDSDQD
jgi:hypothetical protein